MFEPSYNIMCYLKDVSERLMNAGGRSSISLPSSESEVDCVRSIRFEKALHRIVMYTYKLSTAYIHFPTIAN